MLQGRDEYACLTHPPLPPHERDCLPWRSMARKSRCGQPQLAARGASPSAPFVATMLSQKQQSAIFSALIPCKAPAGKRNIPTKPPASAALLSV